MTGWHADARLLDAYVAGVLDPARDASVEQHVQRCPRCRAAAGERADHDSLAGGWLDIIDVLDRPSRSWFERAAIRAGFREDLVRLAVGAAAARAAWTIAFTLVAVFALVVPGLDESLRLWFLALAPLIPVSAVAAAYGPQSDPMYEVIAASPFPTLRLMLLRCLAVFPVSLVLTLIGASLPGGLATSVLWLLPALAMTLLTLGLEPKFGPARVSGIVGVCWLGLIGGTYRAAGSVLPVFAPTGQLLFALVAVIGAAAVFRGRFDVWRA